MTQEEKSNSFKEFKDSFFYGSRTDLNFKFLSILSEAEVADFIQDVFSTLSRSFDSGDIHQVYELVRDVQKKAYEKSARWVYDDRPLTKLKKPLSEAKIMLLTSSGHFVDGNDPQPFGIENMSQEQAISLIDDFLRTEPTLSEIPIDTPPDQLKVRHGGYDIQATVQDHNVSFPLKALHQLKQEGIIGSITPTAFSFVGACAQTPLKKKVIPTWIERFKQEDIDAALLVPVWPVCHVSVGHIARALEESGIATVIVAVEAFQQRLEHMSVPRLLPTPYIMGRPLGHPGNDTIHRDNLYRALMLLEQIDDTNGEIDE